MQVEDHVSSGVVGIAVAAPDHRVVPAHSNLSVLVYQIPVRVARSDRFYVLLRAASSFGVLDEAASRDRDTLDEGWIDRMALGRRRRLLAREPKFPAATDRYQPGRWQPPTIRIFAQRFDSNDLYSVFSFDRLGFIVKFTRTSHSL